MKLAELTDNPFFSHNSSMMPRICFPGINTVIGKITFFFTKLHVKN